jgi:hypothetical protein
LEGLTLQQQENFMLDKEKFPKIKFGLNFKTLIHIYLDFRQILRR